MKNRVIWAVLTLVCLGIMIPISIGFYTEYEIYSKGKLVNVKITSVPDLSGGSAKSSGLMHFNYNGESYSIKLYSNSTSFARGDVIQLRYFEKYNDWFLFPSYSPFSDKVPLLLMLIAVAIGCIYYFIKNKGFD